MRATRGGPPRTIVRRAAVVACGLVLALVAACGGPSGSATGSDPSSGGTFPVTAEHVYGSTEIPAAPQRVVTVGFNDADFALALGVVPVGVRDYTGAFDESTRPWAAAQLGGARPELVGGAEIDFERIAALQPDLILGVYGAFERDQYDLLSRIAPTVAWPTTGSKDGTAWQDQAVITGRALGKEPQARQMVDALEKRFADARAQNPRFAQSGMTVAFGNNANTGNTFVLPARDQRSQLFTGLGFRLPETSGRLSPERYADLNNDVIAVVGAEAAAFQRNPLFPTLPAVRAGRVVYFGPQSNEFNGALGFGSILSLPYALDAAVPQLAAAVNRPAPAR